MPATHYEQRFQELLRLATDSMTARKKFDRTRQSDDLKLSKAAESRLDEFLKTANQAENLTPDLFNQS
jgi:hypothetical protein